jgi:hypothetical protein
LFEKAHDKALTIGIINDQGVSRNRKEAVFQPPLNLKDHAMVWRKLPGFESA